MNARANFLLAPALAALACGTENLASVEPGPLCADPDPQPACLYAASCDVVNMVGRLSVDLGQANVLFAPIQWNNQNPNNADASSGRVNTRDAMIEQFNIHYTGLAVPDGLIRQSILIPAGGSQTAGVYLIPGDTAVIIAAALATRPGFTEIVAEVKARGRYGDGTTFVTGTKKIPVDVCVGCYGAPPACPTAGDVLVCCPQYGQTANCKCVAP